LRHQEVANLDIRGEIALPAGNSWVDHIALSGVQRSCLYLSADGWFHMIRVDVALKLGDFDLDVGLVFQDAQLFPHLSVRQNLLFGRWFAPKAAWTIPFDTWLRRWGSGTCSSASLRAFPVAKGNAWPWAGRCLPRANSC
jgi:hypothetical protein